jgi:hypothetical protein
MEIYKNTNGEDCVVWTDTDGTMHSMTQAAYDAEQAAIAEVKADEAKAK